MRRLTLMALLVGCAGDKDTDVIRLVDSDVDTDTDADTDADSDADADSDTDADADTGDTGDLPTVFSVDVHWTANYPKSAVAVTVHDPQGRTSWNFGMAETEAGGAGWYGEDCYLGFGTFDLCHPISGTRLTLDEQGISDLVEGSSTLLWSDLSLTYYLDDDAGSCWVWGHDTTYYEGLGCTELLDHDSRWVRRGGCSGLSPADVAPLGGQVALTFDDGPHSVVTPQILATLRAHDVPATFFMLGEQAADPANAAIVADILADPLFQIGNHSWDHTDLAWIDDAAAFAQLDDTHAELVSHGANPQYFRFPYGDSSCRTADTAFDYGYAITGWHADTADWCYASGGVCTEGEYWRVPPQYASDMRGFLLDQLLDFDGGIVLMHDIHQYTADTLGDVITDIQAAGFTFTSLDDAATFPDLNATTPYDFPWMGEPCDTSDDTCWQVEWRSWCEPTGDPAQPATAGVCVLPCDGSIDCVDLDGLAPLHCGETSPGQGHCLAQAEEVNLDCAEIGGSVATSLAGYPSGGADDVCMPWAW